MPLGIEMAAAWVRAMTCEEIGVETERSLDILLIAQAEAEKMLQELQTQLSPDIFSAAAEKGQRAKLEAVVAELLASKDEHSPDIVQKQPSPDHLTEREIEILKLMSQGMTNREFAQTLFLSVGTVKWYSSQILSKLHVQNRVQALTQACELNLL
jgi:DNA-binding NarL/FixJ family response regulator